LYLEGELAERDLQIQQLTAAVDHLHDLLQQPDEPKEDPEEVQGMSRVEDN
jgi:hypothetical protein